MGKSGKVYISIASLLFVLLIFLEYTKPKKINWLPSYNHTHTIPFGTKVLYEEMKHLFKGRFKSVSEPPYTFLNSEKQAEGAYFFVNKNVIFGKEEMDALLNWVSEGNMLFIASSSYEESLLDTLGLQMDYVVDYETLKLSYSLSLKNKSFDSIKSANYDRSVTIQYFTDTDSLKSVKSAVGDVFISGKQKKYTNVVQRPFGQGKIILSLFPEAFTNYFLLKSPNEGYVSGLLSYLESANQIFFDTYYKAGTKYYSSPMYVFLNNNSLKWAYYFILIAAFFYIIFEGKRKQRNIPVITPLKNQTLHFVRTIANMYYEKSNHGDIAKYKINQFLAYIRSQQPAGNIEFDNENIKSIASRNGKNEEDTKKLFNLITLTQQKEHITKNELVQLNQMIDDFKK